MPLSMLAAIILRNSRRSAEWRALGASGPQQLLQGLCSRS